jgi:hypothetical protein
VVPQKEKQCHLLINGEQFKSDLHSNESTKLFVLFYGQDNVSVHLILDLLAQQPPVGQSLLVHDVSRSHKTTHHSR